MLLEVCLRAQSSPAFESPKALCTVFRDIYATSTEFAAVLLALRYFMDLCGSCYRMLL